MDHFLWAVAGWWAFGTAVMLLLSVEHPLTPARILLCCLLGLFGPIIPFLIGVIILAKAEFWHRPIFRKDRR